MRTLHPRLCPPSWPRLPRRSARLRLTVLYGCVFLACGAALLTITYLLFKHAPARGGLPPFGSEVPTLKAGHPTSINHGPIRPLNASFLLSAQRAYDADQLLIQSGIALAITAVAAVVLGWFVAGRVLRPLSAITASARRISASSLHERLSLRGPDDELKDLSDTLDDLFARLEASFDAQRRFAANASHELRTPLTRERALLEVTRADPAATTGTWQAVSRDLLAFNAEQERLIEALLTLASSEADLSQREPADLAAITSTVLAVPRPEIDCLGLNVHADIQPAIFDGDPLLVQQLVTNLIDNAVRHNIPGGEIQITTMASRAGAVLSVASSGAVIPAADVDRLFQPFQRLGPRRARRDGGHGLGLAIVRAIATAHAATITARPRPGGGLAVDIAFPSALPRQDREWR
jgi:signal transduction histidine kinase